MSESPAAPPPAVEALAAQVQRLDLQPGDVLVAKLPPAVSMQQAHNLRAYLADLLGPYVRVLVLPADVDLCVVPGDRLETVAIQSPGSG